MVDCCPRLVKGTMDVHARSSGRQLTRKRAKFALIGIEQALAGSLQRIVKEPFDVQGSSDKQTVCTDVTLMPL